MKGGGVETPSSFYFRIENTTNSVDTLVFGCIDHGIEILNHDIRLLYKTTDENIQAQFADLILGQSHIATISVDEVSEISPSARDGTTDFIDRIMNPVERIAHLNHLLLLLLRLPLKFSD